MREGQTINDTSLLQVQDWVGEYSARQNSWDIHRGKEETPKEELLQSAQQQQQQQKVFSKYFSYISPLMFRICFSLVFNKSHAWFSPLFFFAFYLSYVLGCLYIWRWWRTTVRLNVLCVRLWLLPIRFFLWRRVGWWIQVIIQISSFK